MPDPLEAQRRGRTFRPSRPRRGGRGGSEASQPGARPCCHPKLCMDHTASAPALGAGDGSSGGALAAEEGEGRLRGHGGSPQHGKALRTGRGVRGGRRVRRESTAASPRLAWLGPLPLWRLCPEVVTVGCLRSHHGSAQGQQKTVSRVPPVSPDLRAQWLL